MNEQEIRKIVRDEMNRNYKAGDPRIPPHKHNGDDNLRIKQSDVIPNKKFNAFIDATNDGTTATQSFTFTSVVNPTSLSFYGFAANNVSSPATQRAMVNGNAQFGQCKTITDLTQQNQGIDSQFVQVSNSIFTNTTGPAFRVGASNTNFAYVTDGSTVVASATVTKWNANSITIEVILESGWRLFGAYIIT